MKKRILAFTLVVVMLALSLIGCGYSYAKDDMSQYATFDKTSFEAALEKKLVIEDGDFTTDEAIRSKKVIDHIYEILVGKVDTDAKVKEGTVGAHDKLYYCYYATATFGGAEAVLFASSMKESSASSVQFGLTDTAGLAKLVEDKFVGVDIGDMVYSTSTSGTAEAGKTAYISYKVEYDETDGDLEGIEEITVDNERVTLGDASHPVAAKLVGSTIASTIDAFEEGGKKYSNAKVNWVVNSGSEITFTDTTYTSAKTEKDTNGTSRELKDVALTYHVYPVYYLEVEDYNAETILKTLISSYTTETTDDDGNEKTEYAIPSFEANAELVKAVTDLKEALDKATDEYDDALEAKETAEKALSDAKAAVKDGETATEAQQDSIDKAEIALNGNGKDPSDSGYVQGAAGVLADKEAAKKTAEDNYNNKVTELITAIGEATVVSEYEKTVYDTLLEEYNAEIRTNLAKAVWTLMQEKTTSSTDNLPKDAVQNAYDRIMEQHEYTFYEGTYDSSTSESNYKRYKGNFRSYLIAKTGATTYEDAKHEVWADAKEYVLPVITVYTVAAEYGLTVTKDDIKAAKEDTTKNYSYYEHYNGEENVEIAIQFDKLMNYWLESETNEETGVVTYAKVPYTVED